MRKPRVVIELDGLIEQATKERSHYYVKSVCEKSILAIGMLMSENETLRAQLDVAKEALKRYKGLCVHWNKNHHETCGRPADEALAKLEELEK